MLCSKHKKIKLKKMLYRSHPAEHSVWAQIYVHRVTDLERFPVRISKDEAPTPLPVVGPMFISPLSFHLSRALLGAWRFGLFRCVYSSFYNRLNLIREPAFYWVSRERLLPRNVVVTAKWVVSCTRITCIRPLSRCSLTFPASSFFSESVCLLLLSLFCFPSLLFHHKSFVFISGLLAIW